VGIGLGRGAALLVTVAAVITIVAAFAAVGPARRSLRLPTVDALRAYG
jgi:ABC-type antimicrobial peptide transport system permease subunit